MYEFQDDGFSVLAHQTVLLLPQYRLYPTSCLERHQLWYRGLVEEAYVHQDVTISTIFILT